MKERERLRKEEKEIERVRKREPTNQRQNGRKKKKAHSTHNVWLISKTMNELNKEMQIHVQFCPRQFKANLNVCATLLLRFFIFSARFEEKRFCGCILCL